MAIEDDPWAELEALRGRDYAREGIPVILGVETVGTPSPCGGEPGMAAAFRALADALGEDVDPAAILELLAARELERLG